MAPKTFLILIHLFGLVIGLGAATVADMLFVRSLLRNRITREQFSMLKLVTDLVVAGLFVLGISGFGFLVVYWNTDPHLMMNPKMWAKIAVVGVLSANGFLMHDYILPLLERNLDRPLFSIPEVQRAKRVLFGCGAISFTSWMTALVLGVWKEANFKYSYFEITTGYGAMLTLAVLSSPLMAAVIIKIAERVAPAFVQELSSATTVWEVASRHQEPQGESYSLLRKEIRRASRQEVCLSLIAFDMNESAFYQTELSDIASATLEKQLTAHLFTLLRSPDHLIAVGRGKYLCILPGTHEADLKLALRRIGTGLDSFSFDYAHATGSPHQAPMKCVYSALSLTSYPTEQTGPEELLRELHDPENSAPPKLELIA